MYKLKQAVVFPVKNFTEIKIKLLNWSKQFGSFCLLDNHQYHFNEPAFECLLAAGSKHSIQLNSGNAFALLKKFSLQYPGEWLFGHLGYELKNETEQLQSNNFDGIQFPDAHFFVPEIVIKLDEQQLSIYSDKPAELVVEDIYATEINDTIAGSEKIAIQQRISKEDYIEAVKHIQGHILRGDCYEINFCQEFFVQPALIDPVKIYQSLSTISPVPFAALYRLNDQYCICASPERYLKKTGTKIISQPIKGTSRRNLIDSHSDSLSKQQLQNSAKEKAENIMIVDLVRNDLSKICKEGSVKAEELFSIYSFPQVHQMMSTVSGEIENDLHWTDAVKATFPMGSMTGAPKKRVLELIDEYEQTKRGLFSGAIGYIDSDGDFDFNVVIRSILYNKKAHYLSFQAGSAITFYSNAEAEYDECILKAAAITKALQGG